MIIENHPSLLQFQLIISKDHFYLYSPRTTPNQASNTHQLSLSIDLHMHDQPISYQFHFFLKTPTVNLILPKHHFLTTHTHLSSPFHTVQYFYKLHNTVHVAYFQSHMLLHGFVDQTKVCSQYAEKVFMIAGLLKVKMSLEAVSRNTKTFVHTRMQTLSHRAQP